MSTTDAQQVASAGAFVSLTDDDTLQLGDQFDMSDDSWQTIDEVGLRQLPLQIRERKAALQAGLAGGSPTFWFRHASRLRYRRPAQEKRNEWVCDCRGLRNDVGVACYWCGRAEQRKF